MKRLIAAILALVLAGMLPAMAEARLMVVSDIHYLARPLYEGSELFVRALRAGDGKLTQQGDALMDALAEQAAVIRPDALIVTGDLSFNGERLSHEALAERFRAIEAAGVPVWVIPGNHDINVDTPRGYAGDGWYRVEGVMPEAFSAIYADFMEPPEGEDSLSYTARIGDGLWIAMADVSYYRHGAQTFGLFTAAHAAWFQDVLEQAREAGAEVLTATHQSMLAHTQMMRESFQMFGHESMEALSRQGGVRLNLSGHLHIQHIVRDGPLADAATGAFSVWPHRYALVTVGDDGTITYEAKTLDGAYLPEGFSEMSEAWFYGIARDKTAASLADLGLSDDEIERMADYAARFNLAYFAGTYRRDDPAWEEDPAAGLWREKAGGAFRQYLETVMEEQTEDNLRLSLPG